MFQTPAKCQEAPGLSMLSLCAFAARRGTHGSHPMLPPRSILVQGLREHMQDWAVLTDLGKDRKKGELGWMLSQTGAICD